MFDPSGQLAKEYFLTAHLLRTFRTHIGVVLQSLRQIQRKWASTYSGRYSGFFERFDEATQTTLLKNWDKVVAHGEERHAELVGRIDKKEEELLRRRDSVSLCLPLTLDGFFADYHVAQHC